jgi:hypothetical protein
MQQNDNFTFAIAPGELYNKNSEILLIFPPIMLQVKDIVTIVVDILSKEYQPWDVISSRRYSGEYFTINY